MPFFVKALRRAAALLDDWLFPDQVACVCCGTALGSEERCLCAACREALCQLEENFRDEKPPAEGLDAVYAALPYEGQARTLIRRLKYESLRDCAEPLAAVMSRLPTGNEDLLVPIPTTRSRQRQRGFNQAALLASSLSSIWGMPMAEALVRRDERAAQASLSAAKRKKNLEGCMTCTQDVSGRRILLVDDVYTTGSTAKEAARALLAAGAQSVSIAVSARTTAPSETDLLALFRPKG